MARLRPVLASSLASLTLLAACSGTSVTDLRDPIAQGDGSGGPSIETAPTTGGQQGGAGGPSDPSSPAAPSDSSPSAETPVEIRNITITTAKSKGYAPHALDVSFDVVNRAPLRIERLHEVALAFGGPRRTFAALCDGAWFGSTGATNTLTLHIEDGEGESYLFPSCGDGVSGASTRPWGETVTVELRGFLLDGSPWTATGSGSR